MSKVRLTVQEIYALGHYISRIINDQLYCVVNKREAFIHQYNLGQIHNRLEKKILLLKHNNQIRGDKKYLIPFNDIELFTLSIIFNLVNANEYISIIQNKILALIQNTELINILNPKQTLNYTSYEE